MGNYFARPPESMAMGAPPLRTPFTDMTSSIGHRTSGPCLPFNLRWIDCLEAYGPVQGRKKCALLYQDFTECALKWKQFHRIQHMRDERDRQWFMGLIGKGPKVPHFEPFYECDYYAPSLNTEDP